MAQIALALILLVSAGLMIRTFQALRQVNPGFARPSEILTFRIPVPHPKTVAADHIAQTHQRILDRIRQIPGVTRAAASSKVAMDGGGEHDPIIVEQFPTPEGQLPELRSYRFVTPGYFETMGNPLLTGRDIDWNDIYARRPVVLVSRNFALQYWRNPADALGKRIRNSPQSAWREIIGVAGDEHDEGVHKKAPQIVYWPLIVEHMWGDEPSINSTLSYVVRSSRVGTPALLTEVRQAVRAVDSSLPVTSIRSMQKILDRSMAQTSFTLVMLGIASAIALLLGLVGIYGAISYSVGQRTREIGIRMALGAEHGEVRWMFVRHGLLLTVAGLSLGAGATVALTRWMSSLLFGVTAIDPLTYAAVGLVLTSAALLASYMPARRATTIDPARALRAE